MYATKILKTLKKIGLWFIYENNGPYATTWGPYQMNKYKPHRSTIGVEFLTGDNLDVCVAKSLGKECFISRTEKCCCLAIKQENGGADAVVFTPSRTWTHGGPIISYENISVRYLGAEATGSEKYQAYYGPLNKKNVTNCYGRTHLEAAMRCFVKRKMGSTVVLSYDGSL